MQKYKTAIRRTAPRAEELENNVIDLKQQSNANIAEVEKLETNLAAASLGITGETKFVASNRN